MSLLFLIINSSSSSGTISGTTGTLINAVSVADYGAVGDGTTDDTAALAAAIATGSHVYIPKNKTYKITGQTSLNGVFAAVKLGIGQKIIGEDRYTSKIKVTGNGRGIQLSKNSGVHNLTFVGAGKNSANLFNAGLVPFDIGMVISGCDFTDFGGDSTANGGGGIYAIGNTGATPDFKEGYLIESCDFYGNNCGLNIGDRSEFVNVRGGRFTFNNTGLVNYAGNNIFEGLNVMGNTTGIKIGTGANDGHGTFSHCRSNHNTTNLDINGIQIGQTFSGCHFYGGNISLVNSTGVRFVGCDLVGGSSTTLTATNSTILITGCRYPKSPTTTAFVVNNTGSTITEGTNLNF